MITLKYKTIYTKDIGITSHIYKNSSKNNLTMTNERKIVNDPVFGFINIPLGYCIILSVTHYFSDLRASNNSAYHHLFIPAHSTLVFNIH